MLKAIYIPDLNHNIDLPVFTYGKSENEFIHEYENDKNELVKLSYSFDVVEKDDYWIVFSTNRNGTTCKISKSDLNALKKSGKI